MFNRILCLKCYFTIPRCHHDHRDPLNSRDDCVLQRDVVYEDQMHQPNKYEKKQTILKNVYNT